MRYVVLGVVELQDVSMGNSPDVYLALEPLGLRPVDSTYVMSNATLIGDFLVPEPAAGLDAGRAQEFLREDMLLRIHERLSAAGMHYRATVCIGTSWGSVCSADSVLAA